MAAFRLTRSCLLILAALLTASADFVHPLHLTRDIAVEELGSSRLPADLVPTDYTLQIVPVYDVDSRRQAQFNGTVTILFAAVKSTATIVLNSVGLRFGVEDVTLSDGLQGGAAVPLKSLSFNAVLQTVKIRVVRSLDVSRNYSLEISYRGDLSRDLLGLYASSQLDDTGPVPLVATSLSPTYARRMMPCFDEPQFRATFQLKLADELQQVVVSNTYQSSTGSCPTENSIPTCSLEVYNRTPLLSPSQFGFVVSDFTEDINSVSYGARYIGLYTTTLAMLHASEKDKTLDTAMSVYSEYARLTGVDSGMDIMMVAVRDLIRDSVDGWGFLLIRESALISNNSTVSAVESNQRWLLELARSFACVWFGEVLGVTWENTWMKEGFASYLQYSVASKLTGSPDLAALLQPRSVLPGLVADSLEYSHPLNNQGVSSVAQEYEWKDDITCGKGSAIVQTIKYILTEDVFEAGIKNYFQSKMTLGSPEALYAAMQAAADAQPGTAQLPPGVPLAELLAPWVDRPGYPVVTVTRNYAKETVDLTQERFVRHLSEDTDPTGMWWVPLSHSYGPARPPSDPPIRDWLSPNSTLRLQLDPNADPSWLLVNHRRTGFYRVNYDQSNWLLLAAQLRAAPEALDPATRAMLVGDALALARVDRLRYGVALRLADSALRQEGDLAPWVEARAGLDFLGVVTRGTQSEALYKEWVSELLELPVAAAGFAPRGSQTQRLVRGVLMELACDLQLPACARPALQDFHKWQADPNSVARDTLAAAVCSGVRGAGAAELDEVVEALLQENDDVARGAIIRGLGCVANSSFITSRLLSMTASAAGLRHGEATALFKSVTRFGAEAMSSATVFFCKNMTDIVYWSGKDAAIDIYFTLSDRVTTESDYSLLGVAYEALDPQDETPMVRAAFYAMPDNLNWGGRYLHSVSEALSSLVRRKPTPPPATAGTTSYISTFGPVSSSSGAPTSRTGTTSGPATTVTPASSSSSSAPVLSSTQPSPSPSSVAGTSVPAALLGLLAVMASLT